MKADPECCDGPFAAGTRSKAGGSDLVCYCFAITGERADAASFGYVRERVLAGGCACEVKNPSGKCCLPELREAVARRGRSGEAR